MAAPRTKKPVGGSATPNPVHKPLDALDRDILTELGGLSEEDRDLILYANAAALTEPLPA